MKVLQINSFFTVGGPPRIVNGIYDTLIEEGHECKIAAAREKMYKPNDSIRIGGKFSAYINALSCRLFDDDGFRSKAATRKLIKEIEKYNPDVIHLHNLHGYYINIEILFDYLKRSSKPIYWTLHDCWAFTGHCSHFTAAKCERWKTRCRDCPQEREYPSCYTKGRASDNYRRKKDAFTDVPNMTIITPSQWLADLVKQSFLGEYPVEVSYNKIDTDAFKPIKSDFREKYNIGNRKMILGVAQNWSSRKGLNDFIKLAGMLDNSYVVVLVGLTQKQMKELPDSVVGIKRVNDTKELASIYTAADIFVNPSKEETFGLTTVEATSCGTDAIVYKNTACEEIVETFKGVAVDDNVYAIHEAVKQHFLTGGGYNYSMPSENAKRS